MASALDELVCRIDTMPEADRVAVIEDTIAATSGMKWIPNANLVRYFADAALDDVSNAKFSCDTDHVHGRALVGERRITGDHEQPMDFGKRGDDVLGDAVREVLLLGIARHVGEGQHRDRGLAGKW